MKIKMLVMDVDGTLTDGHIYIGPTGEEMKVFNCKDGLGIKELLPGLGVTPVIITGEIRSSRQTGRKSCGSRRCIRVWRTSCRCSGSLRRSGG